MFGVMSAAGRFLNIAAYRFVRFTSAELPEWQSRLKDSCDERQFRGTILLSEEGINVALAGTELEVRAFQDELAEDPRLENLEYKESQSDHLPFNRMLVKIKDEIIAFSQDGIDPARATAPHLEARELKQWLDEGRDVTLLDTRNLYEIHLGTFRGARHVGIQTFRSFPDRVDAIDESERDRTVVTFCTGGIRCEKASALLMRRGFRDVYQLDGGILKYFEECGDAHYDGECFVYDRRVALNSRLEETRTVQCFNCMMPVTAAEQDLDSYVPDTSCPHCIDGKPSKDPATDIGSDEAP